MSSCSSAQCNHSAHRVRQLSTDSCSPSSPFPMLSRTCTAVSTVSAAQSRHALCGLCKRCQRLQSVPRGPCPCHRLFWTCTDPPLRWPASHPSLSCNPHTLPSLSPVCSLLLQVFSFNSVSVHATKDLRAYSVHDRDRERGRERGRRSKRLQNLRILEVLNQIWITVGGREREELRAGVDPAGTEAKGIFNQGQNLSLFSFPLLWESTILTFLFLFSVKHDFHPVSLCFQLNGLSSINQSLGLWSFHSLEVKVCLKGSIVSTACTARCRIYATHNLLYKQVQLCK